MTRSRFILVAIALPVIIGFAALALAEFVPESSPLQCCLLIASVVSLLLADCNWSRLYRLYVNGQRVRLSDQRKSRFPI